MKDKRISTHILKVCITGMMAAAVFIATFINIQIPLPAGETMLHLGNVMCILSAYILGPIYGGLSAGIGSFLYDLTNPLYIDHCIFTLVFKFFMAFICGLIANSKKRKAYDLKFNALAGISGMVTYLILHLSETFIHKLLLGVSVEAVAILVAQKFVVSGINAIIALIIAVPLGTYMKKLLSKQKFWVDYYEQKK
ncbi:MAG: ECF transporter S component [Clostridia bacterium]|nr:ECF transporter S component [Clostridia bacterium]